jgi:hypothetical protein
MERGHAALCRALAFWLVIVSFSAAGSAFGATLIQGTTAKPAAQGTISPLQKSPLNSTAVRLPADVVNDGQIMKVTSPTGQGMFLGTTVKIQWEWLGYENSPVDVILGDEVTTPGVFKQVSTLATGRAALWTNWAIPYTFTPGFYTIRVVSSKNPNNRCDYRIKVMDSTITVTSPNSSFAMATGSTYKIWWTYQGKPGNVKIELTNISGTPPLIIASNVPGGELGTGSYDWVVPQTLAIASGYVVRVTSLVSSSIVGSSQPFSIAPPSITITSPQPGQEFLPAVYVPIRWSSLGKTFGDTVHITAWPADGGGTSLDATCPLKQGVYDQWMPMPLDMKLSYTIRIESTQNRSIGAQTVVTILPRQSQAPNINNDASKITQ